MATYTCDNCKNTFESNDPVLFAIKDFGVLCDDCTEVKAECNAIVDSYGPEL